MGVSGAVLLRPGCVGDKRYAMFRFALKFISSVDYIVCFGCFGLAVQVLNYLVCVG